MKTTIQKLPKSQVELRIEVSPEEFQVFFEKAILNLGKDLEIEGFRKGHAPKEIIEKEIGQEKILKEAAEDCIRENYVKAVRQLAEENKIESLGQPEIEILKLALGNPLEFRAKVSVLPEVKLPDYKQIASQVKKREVRVTNEEIERLRAEKERIEKERRRAEILEKIAQSSEMEIPEILVESEKSRMLENLKQQVSLMLRIGFEEYLKKINKTEEELLSSFLEEAQRRVKNSLVLKEIEKRENIEVPEKELQEEMQKLSKIYQNLDQRQLREYTEAVIRDEKTFQMLEGLAKPILGDPIS